MSNLPKYAKMIIERVLSRSVFSAFATFLITLGVGLLFPGFREYVINSIIDFINRRSEEANLPPYVPEESDWGLYAANGFILAGFIVFGIGAIIDHRQKIKGRQPGITIESDPSWIFLVKGDKNEKDPLVSTSVYVTVDAGSEALKLKKLAFYRYVDGCPMLMCTPTLTRKATREETAFNSNWDGLEVVLSRLRSGLSTAFMQPFVRRPRGFYHLTTNAAQHWAGKVRPPSNGK